MMFFDAAIEALSTCNTATLIIHQPGLEVNDFQLGAFKHLKRVSLQSPYSLLLPYSKESLDSQELVHSAKQNCDVEVVYLGGSFNAFPPLQNDRITVVYMNELSNESYHRSAQLMELDEMFYNLQSTLEQDAQWNVIIASSPLNNSDFEGFKVDANEEEANAEFVIQTLGGLNSGKSALQHGQLASLPDQNEGSQTTLAMHQTRKHPVTDNGATGLFTEYQFFTPGLYMGYLALAVLVPTLFISCRLLSSIQISYHAFDSPRRKQL